MFRLLFCGELRVRRGVLWRTKTKHHVFSWKRLKEREREAQVKKELMEKLLEVSRQAAREVESAVTAVKDPHLRGVIAGVIMQRILDEVDINEKVASGAASAAYSGDPVRKSSTQARILDLQADNFFREPRRLEEVLEELRIRGYHHNKSDARMSLLRLARKKLLRRIALGEGRQRMYLYVSP